MYNCNTITPVEIITNKVINKEVYLLPNLSIINPVLSPPITSPTPKATSVIIDLLY